MCAGPSSVLFILSFFLSSSCCVLCVHFSPRPSAIGREASHSPTECLVENVIEKKKKKRREQYEGELRVQRAGRSLLSLSLLSCLEGRTNKENLGTILLLLLLLLLLIIVYIYIRAHSRDIWCDRLRSLCFLAYG